MTKKTAKTAKKESRIKDTVDAVQDEKAREAIINARVTLLLRHAFLGHIATRLKLVNADTWCETAATDGKHFYYNSSFVLMLSKGEVVFLVGHEIMHCMYDHMSRRGQRDPKLFNVACDYAGNLDLVEHKVGTMITTVGCLHDLKYKGMIAEEIYDLLLEEQKEKQKNGQSIDDLVDQILDEHLDDSSLGDGEDSDESGNTPGKGRPRKLTAEERAQIKQDMREAMLSAAQSSNPGTIPSGIKRLIKEMVEPRMPWDELLQTKIKSTFKQDFSFTRPSRRAHHIGAVLPGMIPGKQVNIWAFLDCSGSTQEHQLKSFLSEVQGIMTTFPGSYTIHLASFDTKVYNYKLFTSDNMEDITTYEPYGCGGTDVNCCFEFMEEHMETDPDQVVFFTDGYLGGDCGRDEFKDRWDTIWVVHGDTDPHPTHGVAAVYK
jgi:predicted metal-dependent peptidase